MLISPHDVRAGVYARASRDARRGTIREGASVGQQKAESLDDAEVLGVKVAEVYSDNNVSSSRYNTKEREDWLRFVADIESGAINFVIFWEMSRGSRDPVEWMPFLAQCRKLAVPIRVVTHQRTYDVRNAYDWKTLADAVIDAAMASEETSMRIKRDKAALRREGRPDGLAPFGHTREYDPTSGMLLRQSPHPRESAVVAELYTRVLAGEPLSRIAADLNDRHSLPDDHERWVPLTRRGSRWRPDGVRRTVLNPAHIGMRPKTGTEELMIAGWESIVSEETWWAVHRLLTDSSRRRAKPGNAKHLLSTIMTCSVCGATVGVHTVSGAPRYVCRGLLPDGSPSEGGGCVAIKQSWADDYMRDVVCSRIAEPALFARVGAKPNDAAAVAAQARADQLQARLDQMWGYAKRLDIEMDEYVDAKRELAPQIAAAKAAARMSGVPPMVRTLMSLLDGVGDLDVRKKLLLRAWPKIEIAGRRELIRGMFSVLELRRGVQRSRVFDPDRVVYEWREWE